MMVRYYFFITLWIIIILSLAVPLVSFAWEVKIIVSTPDSNADSGFATNNLYFGTDPNATSNYDNLLDTIALLAGPIQAYFFHPEYLFNLQKLWRDFRQEILPQIWEMLTDAPSVNVPVNITWSSNLSNGVTLSLIDTENNATILMNSSTQYNYIQTTAQKRILIQDVSGIQDITPPASPTNLRVL